MALTTTDYEVHPFPLHQTAADKELPPPPAVAITPCDPWPRPYYLENGLRRVAPYHFTYNTFCKQRWRGRGILDIFSAEFRDRTREYYQNAIEEGQIVINGKPCYDVNTKVANGDIVSHTLHRHEPPVTAQPIRVIAETDAMIVIDKPAGVPVHPAGRYNYNSVVEIMRAERHHSFNPLPCNRLDRLTSGVMFIAKIKEEAENISQSLRERTVRKEYVSRVKGRFPDGEGWDGDPMRGGVVRCDEPIMQISPVLGLNRARASGKTAKTLFRRIAYYPSSSTKPELSSTQQTTVDETIGSPVALPAPPREGVEDEGYSIVHCLPLTGRTHQIRVHLQFLGHPISNDPIYSNRNVFGPDLGKNNATGEDDQEVIERLAKVGKTEVAETAEQRSEKVLSKLVNQTQQMTLSEAQAMLRREQDALRHTPEAPLYHLPAGYKPLQSGTLHAGRLPPAPVGEDGLENPMHDEQSDPTYHAFVKAHDEMVKDYNKRKGEKMTGEVCSICHTPLYSDPGPHELGIYLHALAYADLNGKWKYRSPMPEWAKPPEGTDGPEVVGEWIYEGAGAEALELGDEKEKERELNQKGLLRNKGDEI